MPLGEGGLGTSLVGDKIVINSRNVQVTKLLGEGGFSYVYLCKEISDTNTGGSLNSTVHGAEAGHRGSGGSQKGKDGPANGKARQAGGSLGKEGERHTPVMVLKVTSILSRQQRDIAEKEAKLLSRLSHPSIIKMYDTCYRTVPQTSGGGFRKSVTGGDDSGKNKDRPQHLILMEYCEGGHALDVCAKMAASGERFDLSTLIIAFGQICNAVSYLHAQRPPIVHRDLKPANFLVKDGAYKLCDFGSAVFGHVELKTSQARAEAEEVIQKTTTQMFRSPEMVDLYMAKKLTQATDVWALGVCLYSMAFLQNCFEEGSNLAILSRKYKIPDDNPYGEGLVELIDRMLTIDTKARSDMTEVILCLSAVYSGRPLPPRKERQKKEKKEKVEEASTTSKDKKKPKARVGKFRTDGQGMYEEGEDNRKPKEAKKLDPNSAAARRRQAAQGDMEFASFHSKFDEVAAKTAKSGEVNQDLAFSTTANPFAAFENKGGEAGPSPSAEGEGDIFASFSGDILNESVDDAVMAAFDNSQNWGGPPGNGAGASADDDDEVHEEGIEVTAEFSSDEPGEHVSDDGSRSARRSRSTARRPRRRDSKSQLLTKEEAADVADVMKDMAVDDNTENNDNSNEEGGSSVGGKDKARRVGARRSVRRNQSAQDTTTVRRRSSSRGDGIRRTTSEQGSNGSKLVRRKSGRGAGGEIPTDDDPNSDSEA